MKYSDLIVPHGAANDIAIQFITENMKNRLISRGVLLAPNEREKQPAEEDQTTRFQIMFDIIDEVLLQFKNYSKQIRSLKGMFQDEFDSKKPSLNEEEKEELIADQDEALQTLKG